MSTQAINDYLTKLLFIEKNVVTYRSLSREFAIHVNVAKNELELYKKQATSEPPAATYLITGERVPQRNGLDDDSRMAVDVDYEDEDVDEGDTDVPEIGVLLVSESDLEGAKSQFQRIHSVHVYGLSPSPIRDADLLCAPTDYVRQIDGSVKGIEMSAIVGRIVSKHIKAGIVTTPATSSTKPKYNAPASSSSKLPKQEKAKESEPEKPPAKKEIVVKPKMTGKLDFSKAKTKAEKKAEAMESTEEAKKTQNERKPAAGSSKVKIEEIADDVPASKKQNEKEGPKRGVKRKSVGPLPSDTESNVEVSSTTAMSRVQKAADKIPSETRPKKSLKLKKPLLSDDEDSISIMSDVQSTVKSGPKKASEARPKKSLKHRKSLLSDNEDSISVMSDVQSTAKSRPKIKKGVVLSDDDELPPSRRKTIRKESAAERSLRAMMDIDDDQVTRASRSRPSETEEAVDTVNEDEDIDMTDNADTVPVPQPKKKRVKKIVPVGQNGLKKRRVVKSRTKVDEKGYMVTEDYSSYESVEEEEPEPEKSKGKKKSTAGKTEDKASTTIGSSKLGRKDSAKAAKPVARSGSKTTKSGAGSKLTQKGSIVNFFGPVKNK